MPPGPAGPRDFVKILDFGVSKFAALESELSMTKTGAVVGTPFYMSPEQARGQEVDARSDLFSVGVVAYQAVTGRVPFNAATFNELVFKIALESPEPAEVVVPDLDPAFAAIIARAMTRDPAGRFQSAAEFQQALAGWAATAGVALERADTIVPGIGGAMRGVSSVELGLAKTVSGDTPAPTAATETAKPGRSIAIGAAAVLAMAVGGLAAYWLLGATPSRVASAPPPVTATVTATATAPAVTATAEPSAAITAAPVETAAPVTAKAGTVATTAPRPKASGALPKASAKAAAPQAPAGRTIGSEL